MLISLRLLAILLIFLALIPCEKVYAQEPSVWINPGQGKWNDVNNWRNPKKIIDPIINNKGSAVIDDSTGVVSCRSLQVGPGELLIYGGGLTSNGGEQVLRPGRIIVTKGTWTINNNSLFVQKGILIVNGGSVVIHGKQQGLYLDSGTATITAGLIQSAPVTLLINNGILNLEGGLFKTPTILHGAGEESAYVVFNGGTLQGTGTGSEDLIQKNALSVTIQSKGATIDINKESSLSAPMRGTGGVNITGGGNLIYTGSNHYTGTTTIGANTTLTLKAPQAIHHLSHVVIKKDGTMDLAGFDRMLKTITIETGARIINTGAAATLKLAPVYIKRHVIKGADTLDLVKFNRVEAIGMETGARIINSGPTSDLFAGIYIKEP